MQTSGRNSIWRYNTNLLHSNLTDVSVEFTFRTRFLTKTLYGVCPICCCKSEYLFPGSGVAYIIDPQFAKEVREYLGVILD
jgi:hypothetical protein